MLRAFSLIEVMVVVAILGVVAALAVPNLLPEVHKAQLNGDSEAAANFIARARAEAMYSKRCTRVSIGGNPNGVVPPANTSGTQLVAERLNSFDCDSNNPTFKIDGGQTIWVQFDFLNTTTSKGLWSFVAADGAVLPSEPGIGTSPEIRFRPNGRVFSDGALTNVQGTLQGELNTARAVLVVKHSLLQQDFNATAAQRVIVVQSNGLVCILDRGTAPTATCP
jgi:prepilin-type N-terminal cleavage/methylation domain-containing protein